MSKIKKLLSKIKKNTLRSECVTDSPEFMFLIKNGLKKDNNQITVSVSDTGKVVLTKRMETDNFELLQDKHVNLVETKDESVIISQRIGLTIEELNIVHEVISQND